MAEGRLHAGLTPERWRAMTLCEQLGNTGAEVGRAIRAREAGDPERLWRALERALELFDLTIEDPAHRGRRKEICRAREVVLDYLVGDNQFGSTSHGLDAYFTLFGVAARRAH